MKRLVIVAVGTFFLFSLLIIQFFRIQIVEGEKWTQEALAQHEFVVNEPFKRGTFFSNTAIKKGHPESEQPFVFDVTKFHLYIDPDSIAVPQRGEVADQIALLADLSLEKIRPEFERKSRSRKLAMWLDKDAKEAVLRWWFPYAKKNKIAPNAIYFITDYKRSYPFGKLLGQVLHTIRDVKEEKTTIGLPTGGLEGHFNDYLKGKPGKRKLMRSPLNPLEIDKIIEEPEDGADIHLTINHTLQAIAEEELEKGVKAAQAKGGWATMMDPHTGEILAMAQYPFFEPANYRDYFNTSEKMEDTKARAVIDGFELGSIMKPVTMAICLKANEELQRVGRPPIFDPLEKVNVTRAYFPGRGSKPLKDTTPARSLNMYMAIQKSSNIYMAQLIERVINTLGNDWYRRALVELFGFGEKTGIELPAESFGIVPRPGKLHPNGTLEWSLATPHSLAFGHNLLATSLQMLRAYAVLANGGYLVRPTLIRKIVDKNSQRLLVGQEKKRFPRVLSKESVFEVVKAMKYSTKPGGTSHFAEINGYTEAGKTGTAEKIVDGVYSHERYISSFIGMAPANLQIVNVKSRFVVIVSIDEPKHFTLEGGRKNYHGGACAAPIFREIARRTLEYLGIEPDDPHGYPSGDPRYDPVKADWVTEVRELKLLFDEWNRKEGYS
ncbi:MAG: Stage V sporulation protein D [Chlamydiae bacterium]|nr:Stage V sporulation protein D [Chlamydiota bacterium]